MLGPCTYCGFCEKFGCGNNSKSSPQTTIPLPVLMRRDNFELRTHSEVTRVNMDPAGKRATGVTYVDSQGNEFEQPANMVFLCAYVLHNVHLLLLSGIGKTTTTRAPATAWSGATTPTAPGHFQRRHRFFDDKDPEPVHRRGRAGRRDRRLQRRQLRSHGPGFHRRRLYLACWDTNGRPIEYHPVPKDTPKWGSKFKHAMAKNYLTTATISTHGAVMSYRGNHLDLDPTYRDRLGRPLLRMTFDFGDNEHRLSDYLTDRAADIAKAMKPREIHAKKREGHYSVVPYQTTHNTGGAAMGSDPKTSFVNRYLQSWDVPNLFVTGSTVFPQNAGYNPTGTIGALTYFALDAIKKQYLKNPGPMVQL